MARLEKEFDKSRLPGVEEIRVSPQNLPPRSFHAIADESLREFLTEYEQGAIRVPSDHSYPRLFRAMTGNSTGNLSRSIGMGFADYKKFYFQLTKRGIIEPLFAIQRGRVREQIDAERFRLAAAMRWEVGKRIPETDSQWQAAVTNLQKAIGEDPLKDLLHDPKPMDLVGKDSSFPEQRSLLNVYEEERAKELFAYDLVGDESLRSSLEYFESNDYPDHYCFFPADDAASQIGLAAGVGEHIAQDVYGVANKAGVLETQEMSSRRKTFQALTPGSVRILFALNTVHLADAARHFGSEAWRETLIPKIVEAFGNHPFAQIMREKVGIQKIETKQDHKDIPVPDFSGTDSDLNKLLEDLYTNYIRAHQWPVRVEYLLMDSQKTIAKPLGILKGDIVILHRALRESRVLQPIGYPYSYSAAQYAALFAMGYSYLKFSSDEVSLQQIVDKTRELVGKGKIADVMNDPEKNIMLQRASSSTDQSEQQARPEQLTNPEYLNKIPRFSTEQMQMLATWNKSAMADWLSKFGRHMGTDTLSASDVPPAVLEAVMFVRAFSTKGLLSDYDPNLLQDIAFSQARQAFEICQAYFNRYGGEITELSKLLRAVSRMVERNQIPGVTV